MATLGVNTYTLIDWAKRQDPDGRPAAVVELLTQTNEVLYDMGFQASNMPMSHRSTVRTGLPDVTWRMLNYGVQPSKSTTKQVDDAIGMLEAYCQVDKALADLNGNSAEFRLGEDRAFLESMNQSFAQTLFSPTYGDWSKYPERFMGLAPRYSSLSAGTGTNIITGGGSGADNTSIWLICWGDLTTHGIFPKGTVAGISHQDLGEQTLTDAAGGMYQGYRTHYQWRPGLVCRDWRFNVRIANIDVSDLTLTGATGANLSMLMLQAIHKPPNLNLGTPVFYCNQTIITYLHTQLLSKTNVLLSLDEVRGPGTAKTLTFAGIPVRRCDAISSAEATVS